MKIKNNFYKRKRLLSEARKDERSAPSMYSKLLKTLPSTKQKSIVRGIIKDEKRHLRLLKEIK